MAKCYFKAVKNNKNFDFFQNVISVATLIRAYLDEKPSEINTNSYMFIRKCRVNHLLDSKQPGNSKLF